MTDTKELRRLLAEATPGEWYSEGRIVYVDLYDRRWVVCECRDDEHGESTAALIVALRNAAPELLDRLERAEAIVNKELKYAPVATPTAPDPELEAMTLCDTPAALNADFPVITMAMVGKLARAHKKLLAAGNAVVPETVEGLPLELTDEDIRLATILCNSPGILITSIMAERRVAELLCRERHLLYTQAELAQTKAALAEAVELMKSRAWNPASPVGLFLAKIAATEGSK